MSGVLTTLMWALLIGGGVVVVLAAGWVAFRITGRLFQRETYNRQNAADLLRTSRPEDWNALREADASWTPDLNGIRLKGVNLNGANLRRVVLKGADLSNSCLENADLTEALLAGANLANTSLKKALLDRVDLRGANLDGADMSEASFDDAILTGTILEKCAPASEPAAVHISDASAVLRAVQSDPRLLHDLKPRQFEELIAELLATQGFNVELTARTGDGGRDIIAVQESRLGKQLFLVQAKRFSPDRPVGAPVVRTLYGVTELEKATKGIVATTSYFTKSAREFAGQVGARLQLMDYDDIVAWLKSTTMPKLGPGLKIEVAQERKHERPSNKTDADDGK